MSKKRLLAAIDDKDYDRSSSSGEERHDKYGQKNKEDVDEGEIEEESLTQSHDIAVEKQSTNDIISDSFTENAEDQSDDNIQLAQSNSDSYVFEEIMKIPDQHEIDILMEEKDKKQTQIGESQFLRQVDKICFVTTLFVTTLFVTFVEKHNE